MGGGEFTVRVEKGPGGGLVWNRTLLVGPRQVERCACSLPRQVFKQAACDGK